MHPPLSRPEHTTPPTPDRAGPDRPRRPRTGRRLGIVLIGALGTAATALAPVAQALDSTPAKTYVTNGTVNAVVPTRDATYIGGSFTKVGPWTGPGVGIDAASGHSTGLPEVDGVPKVGGGSATVEVVAADGSGGFYIGGSFTRVGRLPRKNIAHILADGTVDPNFDPNPHGGAVRVLAVSDSTVYVGGAFSSITGQPRKGLAALDATSGDVTSWNPNPSAGVNQTAVRALAVSGSTVYVGGYFSSIGGQPRDSLAAIDASSGNAKSWNPSPTTGPVIETRVNALVLSGSTVYVAGIFDSLGGQPRNDLAAIDASSGTATSWNPHPRSTGILGVRALAVAGSTVYASGYFSSTSVIRHGLAAFDASSGKGTSWDPVPLGGEVNAIAVSGSTVYVGGDFQSLRAQPRDGLAAIDPSSGEATSWNPDPAGEVRALAVSGSTVYAGGEFASIGGKRRSSVAALDPATGTVTSWNPNANDEVDALRVSGSIVYAGGQFTSIGGKSRNRIAALDRTTGAATSWNPNANGEVDALRVSGSTVYAGGQFTSIGGRARSWIAALNPATGNATSWNPNATGTGCCLFPGVHALAVSGSTVYAGGAFDQIGGKPRNNIAALNAATGNATSWNPNAIGGVDTGWGVFTDISALAVSDSTVLAGGTFSSIGGQPRNNIAALDPATGNATSWNPNAIGPASSDPVISALAVSGSTVYAGGRFSSIGGQPRNNIAALDPATANATSWDPNANGGVGALAFGLDGSLWAGGSFTHSGGAPRAGIVRYAP